MLSELLKTRWYRFMKTNKCYDSTSTFGRKI